MDEEEWILTHLVTMLEVFGHRVETATNGRRAVEAYRSAREKGDPIDVVLLDLTIAGEAGGLQTMRELLVLDPKVKAIISSGYAENPIMTNYRDHGFAGAITKPYRISALQRVLEEVSPD
jgi:two-component system cell cycle sensor histidine kinase/response regulator CckA